MKDASDVSALGLRGISDLRPYYVPPVTAWLGHGPFAIWLVKTAKPRVIVELGTHYGYSFFAMCQAVQKNGLKTQCFAVDTWQGDEHSGQYDDSVFQSVVTHNDQYKGFSTLLRKRFDQALADIPDGSVDILHIDGRHFYDDVKQDFETWVPKLSNSAIVLFHDTEVVDRNFGVKQYWQELRAHYDGFGFEHSHGLGVLFYGAMSNDATVLLKRQLSSANGLVELRGIFVAINARIHWSSKFQQAMLRAKSVFWAAARKLLRQR